MGMPSYLADIQERAVDDQIAASAFVNGSAGAAGVGQSFRLAQKRANQQQKAKRTEADARRVEEQTRHLVDDARVWIEATADVVPLPKKHRR
jgi:hypothetical protein